MFEFLKKIFGEKKETERITKSDIHGFHKLSMEERLDIVRNFANLSAEEISLLKKFGALNPNIADGMIENVISTTQLPLGIATNFLINGKDYLIPFVIEEPSIVAAASNAAKIARASGGFTASSDEPIMIGQIQLTAVKNFALARQNMAKSKDKIKDIINNRDSTLISLGGGFRGLELREISTDIGRMLIVYLLIDVRDAMGANAVNSMCEAVAPFLEKITGGKARLRIISNLATRRLAKAKAIFSKTALEESFSGELKGEEIVTAILEAYQFAKNDIFRCTTHNKGVMNGIDAVAIACGQDFRAIESGAHAFASIDGYHPLTKYYRDKKGDLVGEIELPLAVGTVGGITKTHPIARICFKVLGVNSAREFAEILASVGLAQNFAALRALSTEGIQKGHMKLHARNIAKIAGVSDDEIDIVVERMIEMRDVSVSSAKRILGEIREK